MNLYTRTHVVWMGTLVLLHPPVRLLQSKITMLTHSCVLEDANCSAKRNQRQGFDLWNVKVDNVKSACSAQKGFLMLVWWVFDVTYLITEEINKKENRERVDCGIFQFSCCIQYYSLSLEDREKLSKRENSDNSLNETAELNGMAKWR